MNVSLSDLMKEWVDDHVGGGLYSNASDYITDLILKEWYGQLESVKSI